jgi:capping protein alpha
MKSLSTHAAEHFPSASIGVFPTSSDSKITILTVANKYSPSNFWNGRWRAWYEYDPSASDITGEMAVDVHYYEDGNVRLLTQKPVSSAAGSSAPEIIKAIGATERKYQEELNRGFAGLSEGVFKSLRRQLPVTRQKVEWEKISGYRVGQDIGGGRQK